MTHFDHSETAEWDNYCQTANKLNDGENMGFKIFNVFSISESHKNALLMVLLLSTAGCMKPSSNNQKTNSQNPQMTNNSISGESPKVPTSSDSNSNNATATSSVIDKPGYFSNTATDSPSPSPSPLTSPLPSQSPSPSPSLSFSKALKEQSGSGQDKGLTEGVVAKPSPSPSPSVAKPSASQLKAQKEFNCLNKYYKNQFKLSADEKYVEFKDGTKLIWDDQRNKTPDELFENADINDIFHDLYALGKPSYVPLHDYDPGRYRPQSFFKKIYGATQAEVQKQLVKIPLWKGEIPRVFSSRYGASDALKRIVVKIDKLLKAKPQMKKFLVGHFNSNGQGGIGGTFSFRPIAGTKIYSMHSFGVAIDIIFDQSDYWHNNLTGNTFAPYKNKIPFDIVKIFESEKFVWGGKWYHYDTMHFEYRPELFCMLEAP